jgi:tRNA(Ile)-lysidine synthase
MKAFSYLVADGSNFGVAVSGGSDSMALLMLAADYRQATGIPFVAFTIDHGLRPEAKEEVRFVLKACEKLGVQHHSMRWERTADGPASQDKARRARHKLIAERAGRLGIDRIALGHTRDDRLETFLMRVRQGSGWHGLAGPLPNSFSPVQMDGNHMPLIRPLLAFGREELREELRARDVAWIDDSSNDSDRFERVRMRKLLARMTQTSREKTLKTMDRLMQLRATVAGEASSLFGQLQISNHRPGMDIHLDARGLVGEQAWLRFVEAMVMAAGGGERPPRRDALDRLLARIAARDPQLARGVTLAGAKIRIRKDTLLCFGRAPPRRNQAPVDTHEGPDWGRAGALLNVPDLRVLVI